MNDETHDSEPANETAGSVLRPFEAPAPPPLPPVEASKVVPEPPAATDEVEPEPPVEPIAEDLWTHDTAHHDESDDDVDDFADLRDHDESTGPDEPVVAAPVAAVSGADTVTLPRKPFLVGVGVLLAAIAVLAALWQTGGDDGDTVIDATPVSRDVGDEPADDAPGDRGDVDDTVTADNTSTAALADARAEIASLESVVESLEERPPPALDGTALRRIIVGADAKFVSARSDSVAVVGAFGGVSLIDPDNNRVVANGNVADAATRVMRTSSSVWLTNYADSQVLRFDPATNAVAATFSFPGPDGIDKDGDTIVVASFDGEFVARLDPNTGEILQRVDVGGTPTAVISHPDHGLWAAVFDTGELVEIDRDSFEVIQRVVVGQGPVGITGASSHLWVANHDEGTIAKVDPETGEVVRTVVVGDGPTELVVNNGSAWVTVTDEGTLVQVNANNGDIVSRTPLGGATAGGGPTGISFADGTLWIAMQGEQSVVRVDIR
ncbi:MAG: YncE family protein [Acidimicrobiales bacterium]